MDVVSLPNDGELGAIANAQVVSELLGDRQPTPFVESRDAVLFVWFEFTVHRVRELSLVSPIRLDHDNHWQPAGVRVATTILGSCSRLSSGYSLALGPLNEYMAGSVHVVIGDTIAFALGGAAVFCVFFDHAFGPGAPEKPRPRDDGARNVRDGDRVPDADRAHVEPDQ